MTQKEDQNMYIALLDTGLIARKTKIYKWSTVKRDHRPNQAGPAYAAFFWP